MTPKLTIKDLNCGNCPGPCPVLFGTCFDDRAENSHTGITNVIGCAAHPLALQVLAGPVIEELERLLKESADESYRDAIKLLKEGVKKP